MAWRLVFWKVYRFVILWVCSNRQKDYWEAAVIDYSVRECLPRWKCYKATGIHLCDDTVDLRRWRP
jgi:hypothetical protein